MHLEIIKKSFFFNLKKLVRHATTFIQQSSVSLVIQERHFLPFQICSSSKYQLFLTGLISCCFFTLPFCQELLGNMSRLKCKIKTRMRALISTLFSYFSHTGSQEKRAKEAWRNLLDFTQLFRLAVHSQKPLDMIKSPCFFSWRLEMKQKMADHNSQVQTKWALVVPRGQSFYQQQMLPPVPSPPFSPLTTATKTPFKAKRC